VEDNAKVHTAQMCKKARPDMGMKCLKHSSNSSDLNPIEMMLFKMKMVLAEQSPYITSQQQLREAVMKIWDRFGHDGFNRLIESMPERIRLVIKAKEGFITY